MSRKAVPGPALWGENTEMARSRAFATCTWSPRRNRLRCQVKGNGFALRSPAGLCLWAAAVAERAQLGPSHPSAPTVSGSLSLVLK